MNLLKKERLLAMLGRFYLSTRLRNPAKIERELSIKYGGRYRNAGLMLLFDIFMALAVVAVVSVIAVVLYLLAT